MKEWFALSCFTMGNQNKYNTNGNGNQDKYLTDIRTQFFHIHSKHTYLSSCVQRFIMFMCLIKELSSFVCGDRGHCFMKLGPEARVIILP